ncbi:MAG: cell division protein FtsB [Pseudomonadota bacterium]
MVKLIAFLALLTAALQYRLWWGDGGVSEYKETLGRIEELRREGEQRRARNAAVAADVADLRDGTDAIEERARHDLGLVKPGETFVQVYQDKESQTPTPKSDGSAKTDQGRTKSKAKLKSKPQSPVIKPDEAISPP